MLQITLEPVGEMGAVGRRWQALEAFARVDFFRSWTFLGCFAHERFAGALLLSATLDWQDVGLGLLGYAKGRFWLNQIGDAAQDAVFIEHNGLLVRDGHDGVATAMLAHAARRRPVVLAGVDAATLRLAAGAGWLVQTQSRPAPRVDLARLTGPYLDTLSANARAQIRRAIRGHGTGLKLARADSVAEAQAWFAELVTLHQASWTGRGQPGAFATTTMRRFHAALIARAWPLGQADILRVTASGGTAGLLYCLIQDGHVHSYQSGFAYDATQKWAKPGLVCHALAIEHYAAEGAHTYDLLAGVDRYKQTLTSGNPQPTPTPILYWATLYRPWSAAGLAGRVRQAIAQRAGRWRRGSA